MAPLATAAGSKIRASIPMIAMTASSSINVKPLLVVILPPFFRPTPQDRNAKSHAVRVMLLARA